MEQCLHALTSALTSAEQMPPPRYLTGDELESATESLDWPTNRPAARCRPLCRDRVAAAGWYYRGAAVLVVSPSCECARVISGMQCTVRTARMNRRLDRSDSGT